MKFIILAYNPDYTSYDKMNELGKEIEKDQGCLVYLIPHIDRDAEPVYCVQLVDTGGSSDPNQRR